MSPSLGPMGRGGARRRTRRRMNSRLAASDSVNTVSQENTQPTQQAGDRGETGYLDELEKLGELRDKGIITEEEFSAKKKQLLGL